MVNKKDIKKVVSKGKKKLHKATESKSAGIQDFGKVIVGAAAGIAAAVGIEKLQDKKTRAKLKKELELASNNFKKEMERLEKTFAKEYPEIKKDLLTAKKNLESAIKKGITSAKEKSSENKNHTIVVKAKPKKNTKKAIKKTTKKTTKKKSVKKVPKKTKKR